MRIEDDSYSDVSNVKTRSLTIGEAVTDDAPLDKTVNDLVPSQADDKANERDDPLRNDQVCKNYGTASAHSLVLPVRALFRGSSSVSCR